MSTTYKTPGVYVKEVSLFPRSVAQVETAIPAFIGYTEKAKDRGEDLSLKPIKIRSLVEYEALFGGAPEVEIDEIVIDIDNNVTESKLKTSYLLYDGLRLFFDNGGSQCYIISVGKYGDAISLDAFKSGLGVLAKEDEPTLILFPDATRLPDGKLYEIQKSALGQCNKLQDRFSILDLDEPKEPANWDDTIDEFRNKIGIDYLKYGAAYTPYLKTNLPKKITPRTIIKGTLKQLDGAISLKKITNSLEAESKLVHLENAINDLDLLTLAIRIFLKGEEKATLESHYNILLNEFKEKVALHNPNQESTTNDVRSAYKALFEFLYRLTQMTIDSVASNTAKRYSFSDPATTDSEKKVVYLTDSTKDLITEQLRTHLLKLNSYSKGVESKLGGTEKEMEDVWKAFNFTALEWTGADGKNAFDDAVVEAPAEEIYPETVSGTNPKKRAAQVANMKNGEPYISSIFRSLNEAVASMIRSAETYESTYGDALISVFPTLKNIIDRVKNSITLMPPSCAIAGVYARVDANRGVHKAPANTSLNSVVGTQVQIGHDEQASLNVDTVAGKSINAIRPFTGKGILVWGARTLAGNDNEWRYVSVRRFFIMVEESVKKATEHYVFEPNDANTWIKVRSMIENFLLLQWRAGALAGATPEQAFFVKVGLNQTMTALDVLEGRMIVEIGMAVVRPAEFIILKFSHKMQES